MHHTLNPWSTISLNFRANLIFRKVPYLLQSFLKIWRFNFMLEHILRYMIKPHFPPTYSHSES